MSGVLQVPKCKNGRRHLCIVLGSSTMLSVEYSSTLKTTMEVKKILKISKRIKSANIPGIQSGSKITQARKLIPTETLPQAIF